MGLSNNMSKGTLEKCPTRLQFQLLSNFGISCFLLEQFSVLTIENSVIVDYLIIVSCIDRSLLNTLCQMISLDSRIQI